MCYPEYSSGFSWSPEEHQSTLAPYTEYPGASYLVQMSGTGLCFTPPVLGSSAFFSRLEGDPRVTSGARTAWFQGPPQAAEPGSRDPLPNGAWRSDLTRASKMLREACQTSENKTQTQVAGGKKDLLC
jgi:hypothetical protein